ncbi:hypothetical protein D5125_02015 [Magnetovirga frankeli]|uniref:hypothetical protein n=1 Tax=Magnetovirga frankeli TaxID=947516 RepID=UPI0012934D18|nr:hypothetical protein D5125_02015 [gamma proteobacterium SS-5]
MTEQGRFTPRRLLAGLLLLPLLAQAQTQAQAKTQTQPQPLPTWEGWIVGRACAGELRVSDCPLRQVSDPVLLLENGRFYPFRYGDDSAIRYQDIDEAFSKRVRLTGAIEAGVIQSVRLDLLEVSAERTFFKGCL